MDVKQQVRDLGIKVVAKNSKAEVWDWLKTYGFQSGMRLDDMTEMQLTLIKYVLIDVLEGCYGRTPRPDTPIRYAQRPRYLLMMLR